MVDHPEEGGQRCHRQQRALHRQNPSQLVRDENLDEKDVKGRDVKGSISLYGHGHDCAHSQMFGAPLQIRLWPGSAPGLPPDLPQVCPRVCPRVCPQVLFSCYGMTYIKLRCLSEWSGTRPFAD